MDKRIELLPGVVISTLKIIDHPKGNIFHGLKGSEDSYHGFGEVYFSAVNHGEIKGWKKHNEMIMNLVVVSGRVKFYFSNDDLENIFELEAGENYYVRITVFPGIWVSFEGRSKAQNLIMNFASIAHDPDESINIPFTHNGQKKEH